jgi:hypothetical protein
MAARLAEELQRERQLRRRGDEAAEPAQAPAAAPPVRTKNAPREKRSFQNEPPSVAEEEEETAVAALPSRTR